MMRSIAQNNDGMTLKERYQRHTALAEEMCRLDERLMVESAAALLLERLSDEDSSAVDQMQDKLAQIQGIARKMEGNGEMLLAATKEAEEAIAKFDDDVAGKILKKMASLSQKLGGRGDVNPIIKCTAFLKTLQAGFSRMPRVLKGFLKDKVNQSGVSPKALAGTKFDDLVKLVLKEFEAPSDSKGFFGKLMSLFGGRDIPYISDEKKFVEQMLSVSISQLGELITAASDQSYLRDLMAQPSGSSGGGGSAGGGTGGGVHRVSNARDLVTAASPNVDLEGMSKDELRAKLKQETEKFAQMVSDESKVRLDDVKKIIKALVDAKLLKMTKAPTTTEGINFRPDKLLITRGELEWALRLYVECGCRSRVWVNALMENDYNDDILLEKLSKEQKKQRKLDVAKAMAGTKGGGTVSGIEQRKKAERRLASLKRSEEVKKEKIAQKKKSNEKPSKKSDGSQKKPNEKPNAPQKKPSKKSDGSQKKPVTNTPPQQQSDTLRSNYEDKEKKKAQQQQQEKEKRLKKAKEKEEELRKASESDPSKSVDYEKAKRRREALENPDVAKTDAKVKKTEADRADKKRAAEEAKKKAEEAAAAAAQNPSDETKRVAAEEAKRKAEEAEKANKAAEEAKKKAEEEAAAAKKKAEDEANKRKKSDSSQGDSGSGGKTGGTDTPPPPEEAKRAEDDPAAKNAVERIKGELNDIEPVNMFKVITVLKNHDIELVEVRRRIALLESQLSANSARKGVVSSHDPGKRHRTLRQVYEDLSRSKRLSTGDLHVLGVGRR